jgi:phage terminase small subunit
MMALTDKQVKFINEYMIDMNATAAYGRAGYAAEGNSAEASASRLLRNVKIQQEINKRQQKLQEESGMSVKWVLEQYQTIITDNIAVDPAVAKGALDSVAKHYGMFKDKIEITGTLSVEKLLEQL